MIWPMLVAVLVIVPAVMASALQDSRWPFEPYSMFSRPIVAERLKVLRIAYLDQRGNLHWWKPKHYKLSEMFGQDAEICVKPPMLTNYDERLSGLFSRIEHCIANDPGATKVAGIYVFVRQCGMDNDTQWHIFDTLIARRMIVHPH